MQLPQLLSVTGKGIYYARYVVTMATLMVLKFHFNRVTCSGDAVVSVDLSPDILSSSAGGSKTKFSFSISGAIPNNVGLLSELTYLNLAFNSFGGTIPMNIGSLAKLNTLDLSGNKVSGYLPSQLGNLLFLEKFSAYGNCISGSLPQELFGLSNLKHLSLGSNSLTGSLPSAILLLSSVEYLDVSDNSFTGALSLYGSPSLEFVNASYNMIDAIADFSLEANPAIKLETVILDYNELQSLPTALNITSIVTLSSSGNNFTNVGLPDISGIDSLSEFRCSACSLTSVPSFIVSLTNINYLDLSYNSFRDGGVLQEVSVFPKLEFLDLTATNATGSIPSALGSLRSLESLYLGENSLTGKIPESLCDLEYLSSLDISSNPNFGCFSQCLAVDTFIHDSNVLHCYGTQDLGICDLEAALSVRARVSSILFPTDSISFESAHPRIHGTPGAEMYSLTLDDDYFTQFKISFDKRSELQNEFVTFCDSPSCGTVFGVIGGFSGEDFPGVGQNPVLTFVSNKIYIEVSELNASTFTDWGFSIEVSPSVRGTGWSCTTRDDGTTYATGLCEEEWTGIECDFGTQVSTDFIRFNIFNHLLQISSIELKGLELGGTIPSTVSLIEHLHTFDLSYNSITGSIPTSLFSILVIETIELSANKLSGSLPVLDNATVLALESLYSIALSGNELTGILPEFPLDVPFLQELYLNDNKFTGDCPERYCNIDTSYLSVSISSNPKLCYINCWIELHPEDESSACSNEYSGEEVSIIIIVAVVCGFVSLVLLLVIFSLLYQRRNRIGVNDAEKLRRLNELPVHLAILTDVSSLKLLDIVRNNKKSAKERDYDGKTAIDLILQSKSSLRNVTTDVLFELVNDSLPFDTVTGQAITDPEVHVFAWPSLVGTTDEGWVKVVAMILERYKRFVEVLAEACDEQGRHAIDIATPVCKDMITRLRLLHGKYDVKAGPPIHISGTCCVRQAIYRDFSTETPDEIVVLKFLRHRESFLREVNTRKRCSFDLEFVIAVHSFYDGDDDSDDNIKFRNDAKLKGFAEYPYCIVMEAGDCTLQSVVAHQNMAGNDWDEIRHVTKHLMLAVRHVHEKGAIHGDLKPMNIVIVNGRPQLIDFDASVSVEEKEDAGVKVSTAYCAPELLCEDENGSIFARSATSESPKRTNLQNGARVEKVYSLVTASYAMDMWSIGAILYLLCTGCTLFLSTVEDDIYDEDDLKLLLDWTPTTKAKKLASISNPTARNLCSMLMAKDPSRRLDCARALSHSFFTGHVPTRLIGEKAKYDIFISYRVKSDKFFALKLYEELQQKELNVWMDLHSLIPGENWEEGFCKGLVNSAFMVCIVSKESINHPNDTRANFSKLETSSKCDNVLLEWRLGLELLGRGLLAGLFPVLVGDQLEEQNKFSDYFRSNCAPRFDSDVVVDSVEQKLYNHLEREGLGLPYKESMSVKSVTDSVLSSQGAFIRGELDVSMRDVSDKIIKMITNYRNSSSIELRIESGLGSPRPPDNLTMQEYQELLQEKETQLSLMQDKVKELEAYARHVQEEIREKDELNKLLMFLMHEKNQPVI